MLRDEMELYSKLTGEDGTHVPIIKLGAYLDGYEKGLSVLEDIKAEIDNLEVENITCYYETNKLGDCTVICKDEVMSIIDKHMKSEDKE